MVCERFVIKLGWCNFYMKTKVLMVLTLVFMMLPMTSAFAYSGGLLDGKTLQTGANTSTPIGTTDAVTDGDLTTFFTTQPSSGSSSVADHIFYNFGEAKTIKYYRIKADSDFTVYYYNASKSPIKQDTAPKLDGTLTAIDVTGVYYVAIVSKNAISTNHNVYEMDFFDTLPPASYPNVDDLSYSINNTEVSLTWLPPSAPDTPVSGYKIYRNSDLIATLDKDATIYVDNTVEYDTTYSYRLVTIFNGGIESTGATTTVITGSEPIDETKIPPSNPTALTVTDIASDSAKLQWSNSSDNDLDSVNIYKEDGTLLTNIYLTTSYTITDLSPLTNYSFSIALVDRDGNVSGKVPVTFKTLEGRDTTPPQPIENVKVTEGNGALYVSWDKSSDSDVVGYDVYINGVKHNDKPIQNTFYTATGLENGVTYDVQVVAIDKAGNSSEVQAPVVQAPSEDAIPIFKTEYSLEDVANGISAWFSEYWLILAFAISIPLSFYIASRVKLMFLE